VSFIAPDGVIHLKSVAYYSQGEFDVKFEDLLQQVERLCDERSRDAALAGARRSLLLTAERFKRKEKLAAKDRQQLANALETVRRTMGADTRYQDQIADIEDYVDANWIE
jgi:hypothetical protein